MTGERAWEMRRVVSIHGRSVEPRSQVAVKGLPIEMISPFRIDRPTGITRTRIDSGTPLRGWNRCSSNWFGCVSPTVHLSHYREFHDVIVILIA